MSDVQPASEGRIVHVRTPGVPHCQPAIVVRNWSPLEPGAINCLIFRDGSNDEAFKYSSEQRSDLVSWGTSISYLDAGAEPIEGRSWHWPERVG